MTLVCWSVFFFLIIYILRMLAIHHRGITKGIRTYIKIILKFVTNPFRAFFFFGTWILLESPAIIGIIQFVFTHKGVYLAQATAWIILTGASKFPIPVFEICMAVTLLACGIRKWIRLKLNIKT